MTVLDDQAVTGVARFRQPDRPAGVVRAAEIDTEDTRTHVSVVTAG